MWRKYIVKFGKRRDRSDLATMHDLTMSGLQILLLSSLSGQKHYR
jgi:hypothetical protein